MTLIQGRRGRGVGVSAAAFAVARACARRWRLAQAHVGAIVARADSPLRESLCARGLGDVGCRCRRASVLLRRSCGVSRQVALYEIGGHRRSTMAAGSLSNNRANLWTYCGWVVAMYVLRRAVL